MSKIEDPFLESLTYRKVNPALDRQHSKRKINLTNETRDNNDSNFSYLN
jgi:hypothetical protein